MPWGRYTQMESKPREKRTTLKSLCCSKDTATNLNTRGTYFQSSKKKNSLWKVPLLTSSGYSSRAIKAYRLRNVLPHVPAIAWGEFSLLWGTRWKPFGSPCLHYFLLKSPHKPTHRCCNMNLFPLFLPLAVPLPILFFFLFQSRTVSLWGLYFSYFPWLVLFLIPINITPINIFLNLFSLVPKQLLFLAEATRFKTALSWVSEIINIAVDDSSSWHQMQQSSHYWEYGAGSASAGRYFPAHS